MRFLSRFASPAGFVLVLLLFFLLPFVSASCDVPGYGEAGTTYTGSHLVSGTDPEVPAELQDLADDPESPVALTDPPDPGVQLLAIGLAVLAAAGVLTALIPHLKARLLGGAALAAGTLVVTVVTMSVAQSNLQDSLADWARQTGAAESQDGDRLRTAVTEVTHTEIGFWLMIVVLALITLMATALGLLGDRLKEVMAARESGQEQSSGFPFHGSDRDD
ncbi:hypothetical protein [Actinophytocola algeriensis]|uniref:Uncharacterized protein n=1 Tax=Actinophytocola algeriensis TaxID=1768010 RepID=A0A7W7Q6N1_9PSEU|nr:hypothetical protein [Actinophytocola algeriensis]MBB4908030.1 hypothetical protein [Actinophytocola algeriensis]MBE1480060.1 hypothetical protein [Actinophytocola algeriensis]